MSRIRKLTRLVGLALAVSLSPVSLTAQEQTSRSASASSTRARGLDWLAKGRPDLALNDFEIAIAFGSCVKNDDDQHLSDARRV